jgi:hypothetical protein
VVSFPVGARHLSFLQRVLTGSVAHEVSYSVGTGRGSKLPKKTLVPMHQSERCHVLED